MENAEVSKTSEEQNKQSVLFATVQGVGVGVLACGASALVADGLHTSYVSRKPCLPSLKRVCDFIASNKQSELKTSWVILGVSAILGSYSFAQAIKHNRQVETSKSFGR